MHSICQTQLWATDWHPHDFNETYSIWAFKVESVVSDQHFAFHSAVEWTDVDDFFICEHKEDKSDLISYCMHTVSHIWSYTLKWASFLTFNYENNMAELWEVV